MDEHQEEIKEGKIQVFFEDECHLLEGNVCGLTWCPRNQKVEIPIENPKNRQTYYGSFNALTGQFHPQMQGAGNTENTIDYLKYLSSLYPDSKIWMFWDGAKYHSGKGVREYLESINQGLEEKDWKIRLFKFAPHAPEQNPVEQIWSAAKNFLRRNFSKNKNFEEIKKCFLDFLNQNTFYSKKVTWYLGSIGSQQFLNHLG